MKGIVLFSTSSALINYVYRRYYDPWLLKKRLLTQTQKVDENNLLRSNILKLKTQQGIVGSEKNLRPLKNVCSGGIHLF